MLRRSSPDNPRFALLLEASQFDHHFEAGDILQDTVVAADLERLVPAHELEADEADLALPIPTRRMKKKLKDISGLQIELSKLVTWVLALRSTRLGLFDATANLPAIWPEAYAESTPVRDAGEASGTAEQGS